MSDVKAVLTEAIEAYFKYLEADGYYPAGCDAAQLADRLLALPGVAVIQLPGPDHVAQGDEFENGRTEYALGDVSVFEDGEIHLFGATWQLSDVKTLAAALLAAAVLSEETTK